MIYNYILGLLLFLNSMLLEPTNTQQLITAMHSRYHGKFNKNITFIQLNTHYNLDGTHETTTWFEAFHFPGKYRVDYGYTPNVDGVIFANDSVYHFKNGIMTKKGQAINDILLLSGDIYFVSPTESMAKLKKIGYNTDEFHEDILNGKEVYVVGAKKGDLTTPQFWIDKENLFLSRNISVSKENSEIEDAIFTEHSIVGQSWIESKVDVYVNGRKVRTEKYTEVTPENKIHHDVFNPHNWGKIHWHSKK